jgi:hypothetical protein
MATDYRGLEEAEPSLRPPRRWLLVVAAQLDPRWSLLAVHVRGLARPSAPKRRTLPSTDRGLVD